MNTKKYLTANIILIAILFVCAVANLVITLVLQPGLTLTLIIAAVSAVIVVICAIMIAAMAYMLAYAKKSNTQSTKEVKK
jgi:uncharacterized membrane protein